MQFLYRQIAGPLPFLSFQTLLKDRVWNDSAEKEISRVRCFACTIRKLEGKDAVCERRGRANAMSSFRKLLRLLAGCVNKDDRLRPGKSQFFKKKLECDWPNWCARVDESSRRKEAWISAGFLSQSRIWPAPPAGHAAGPPREVVSAFACASTGSGQGAARANAPLGSAWSKPQAHSPGPQRLPCPHSLPLPWQLLQNIMLFGELSQFFFFNWSRFCSEITWQNVRRKNSKKF